ncbi:MAG: DMT family transporter [Firmicutes bacterium]|nr:DMT family transporter [Bacillota bacterium]
MDFIKKYPIIMIGIGVIGISLSSIFVKLSSAPSGVTAAYRLLWTVLLMTPSVLLKKETRRELGGTSWRVVGISILSGVFLAIHFVLWFESLAHTSVASSTTLVCTEVIWVSLGYCIFLKGKLSFKAVMTIACAFLGSTVIAVSDSGSGRHLYGDMLSLLSAIAVAVYMLLGNVVRKNTSTTVYTYIVYLSCAVCLVAFCGVTHTSLVGYGGVSVLVGLLLAIFSTILGHSIFSWCLKYFSPSFVSASKLLEPVVAALIAIPVFAEYPKPLTILGGVMIILSVWYYSRIEKPL